MMVFSKENYPFKFIKKKGENTSEHSENFDLEAYLNFCSKHPLGENSDEEEGLEKKKKQGEEEDEIITSKDIKNKKQKK